MIYIDPAVSRTTAFFTRVSQSPSVVVTLWVLAVPYTVAVILLPSVFWSIGGILLLSFYVLRARMSKHALWVSKPHWFDEVNEAFRDCEKLGMRSVTLPLYTTIYRHAKDEIHDGRPAECCIRRLGLLNRIASQKLALDNSDVESAEAFLQAREDLN